MLPSRDSFKKAKEGSGGTKPASSSVYHPANLYGGDFRFLTLKTTKSKFTKQILKIDDLLT